ncbi:hypothetical protein OG205_12485 [Lentzea sp. NBC_00516]|uniref:hypothetical protein n=1 Tax=Lentzea sp. NBC_00516 TaxID=2903582 RepID=UPI002E802BC1|nr:hypothetical protein [Lentzea sp. NBC_00516]WUD27771.1 hypothetical protein OG205_12485 [Lentzea sp. NBC_00516]
MPIGVGTVLLALVLLGVWPQSAGGYRSTVESSVQDAVSSVGVARIAGQNSLKGNTFSSYESTVLDDARTNVTSAFSDISELSTPDSDSQRTRDEVLPLLQECVRLIDDLGLGLGNDDQASATRSVDALGSVGERLAAVLEGLR